MVDLTNKKILIVLASIFMLIFVGCSNGIKDEGNKIVVEKRVGEEDKYELYLEITGDEEVKKIKDILANIKWEEGAVNTVLPPEYKFYFEKDDGKTSHRVYSLWINGDADTSLLVLDSESKFVQNDKKVTKELFNLIIKED